MRTELTVQFQTSTARRLCGQLSLVAVLAGLGAGCSGMPFREPIFTGSTANQQQIISGQASAYPGGPGSAVQSNDLPPPAGAQATAYAAPGAPQPYIPPKPYAASGMPMPLGQIGAAPAGQAPTLVSLGSPPSTLNAQAAQIDGSATGGSHLVQSGDTMYNIARRYGVSVDALIAANGGSSVARLGQRLAISGGGNGIAQQPNVQVASVDPQSVPAPAPVAQAPQPAASVAVAPAAQAALAPQTGAAAAALPAAPQAAADPSGFRWPVRGRVISGFGKKPDGERNDGINLAVPEGTAVKAAEDGTVIYAGNELKSYGNLVLVRHSNGWVSAYAHNSELKVTRGQEIRRGEIVAMSGMSGGVTTPQVHFELRKDATPVDPLQHLTES